LGLGKTLGAGFIKPQQGLRTIKKPSLKSSCSFFKREGSFSDSGDGLKSGKQVKYFTEG